MYGDNAYTWLTADRALDTYGTSHRVEGPSSARPLGSIWENAPETRHGAAPIH